MRASSLIGEILRGCGVRDNAAQAMETVAEQLLDNMNSDEHVFVEVNGVSDFNITEVYKDGSNNLCIAISMEGGE